MASINQKRYKAVSVQAVTTHSVHSVASTASEPAQQGECLLGSTWPDETPMKSNVTKLGITGRIWALVEIETGCWQVDRRPGE